MHNSLISIVVPCYNVAKHLEKCLQSIINQSYQNLEIILVDDGSTDETPKLCDQLSQTDSRIKVIHKENSGVSEARNIGIITATGKYISFMDSDDWIEADTINTAYNKLVAENLDLVVWGYSADFVDENEYVIKNRNCSTTGICEKGGNASVLTEFGSLGLSGYVWNKLYKIDIIKNNKINFNPDISLYEDLLFNSLYFSYCKKIAFIDYIGNHYIQRNCITLGTKHYENAFELELMACTARENMLKCFGIDKKKISNVMGIFYYSALNTAVITVSTEPNINHSDLVKKMKSFLNNKMVQDVAKKSMKASFKHRLLAIFVRIRMAAFLVWIKK